MFWYRYSKLSDNWRIEDTGPDDYFELSEKKYLDAYEKNPIKTDFNYFVKAKKKTNPDKMVKIIQATIRF